MTRKQEVNYRTGRQQSGANCGYCLHIIPQPGKSHLDPHYCTVLGPGPAKGHTVTHDGICDRFDLRRRD